jgi:hypothetical protein
MTHDLQQIEVGLAVKRQTYSLSNNTYWTAITPAVS